MKEVYYKGKAYDYRVNSTNGKRCFQLLENGVVKHTVEENELDVKSIVSMILDSYYRNVRTPQNSAVG